jgi:hypothetical protein
VAEFASQIDWLSAPRSEANMLAAVCPNGRGIQRQRANWPYKPIRFVSNDASATEEEVQS